MFDDLKQHLRKEEGVVPHLYLDTEGNVTAGIGHLCATPEAAVRLQFLTPSGLPATADQIRREYAEVQALEPGKLPAYYAQRTTLRLTQQEMTDLLDGDVTGKGLSVSARLRAFQRAPEPAQSAILDMAFNLGVEGLIHKFPLLLVAADSGDWSKCAEECQRRGVSAERNQATADWFRQAAAQRGVHLV